MNEENVFAGKKTERLPKLEPTLLQRGGDTLFQLKSGLEIITSYYNY
jgi:hypothetical protein